MKAKRAVTCDQIFTEQELKSRLRRKRSSGMFMEKGPVKAAQTPEILDEFGEAGRSPSNAGRGRGNKRHIMEKGVSSFRLS